MNNKIKAHVKAPCGPLNRRGSESVLRSSRHYVDYMSDELYSDSYNLMMIEIEDSEEY